LFTPKTSAGVYHHLSSTGRSGLANRRNLPFGFCKFCANTARRLVQGQEEQLDHGV
jgi:hypothetical protein